MKLPIGISDFKELIEGDYLFADKSLLIKDIIEDGSKVILFPRPRRFGKTLNLSMLYYFLRRNHSNETNLFDGLKISEDKEFCQKHQQQYPVIFITFKDIKKSNYADAYRDIVALIQELYATHRYLLEGDVLHPDEKLRFNALLNKQADSSDVESAIAKLSQYMEKKFNKTPIILIDEYDTPIQEAYLRENYQGEAGYYQKMIDLMRSIFGRALKDNKSLGKAIITGITRIAQESLFSGLNNLSVFTLLREKFGQYFGFTEEEVKYLIEKSKKTVPLSGVKEWYNGYQVGKFILYNPWSIINCLDQNGVLQPYWKNTSSNDLVAELLKNANPRIKNQLEELLQGNVIERPLSENLVFTKITTHEDALWSLLFYTGYLKVISRTVDDYPQLAKIAIPNKEVRLVYDEIVTGWFQQIDVDLYRDFIQSLVHADMDKFKRHLSDYIMQSGSFFDFHTNTSEQIFHVFILGLVVGLRTQYYIYSNQESGLGRFDVIFIPKNKKEKGIVLEFKTSDKPNNLLEKAQEALEQIKDKQYIEIFKQQDISEILAIGLAFCGKQVELASETISQI
ncbi:MAG: AAA family ATPase [Verrucomicrobia bacterium]|nr:MAG: AAA family ATPase [Verrucomicrobiota bacterium]